MKGFLAVDIGASGGKAFVGRYDGERLSIEEVLRFANEGCYGGKYRLLKNATGLWLVQELLREWKAKDQSLDYPSLVRMAGEARPFSGKIDVESPRFKRPASMERAILQECADSGSIPCTRGEIVRTALEGIAQL